MNSVQYAINEGFKMSWKGALLGGTAGAYMGHAVTNEITKNDKSMGIMWLITFPLFTAMGVASGTLGGFVCGTVKGGLSWAIKGPYEPHAPDDVSVNLGIMMTCGAVSTCFKCLSNHHSEN